MVIGYLMRVMKIPTLPLLISFLLGGMMESNFRRALLLSGGDYGIFITSKFSAFFLLVSLGMIVYTVLQQTILKRKK